MQELFGIEINRAAIRFTLSGIAFILVQAGWLDPVFYKTYENHIVDIVSAILLIIFAVEFAIASVIKLYHKLKNDPNYIESPHPVWSHVRAILVKYVVIKPELFKKKDTIPAEVSPTEPLAQ